MNQVNYGIGQGQSSASIANYTAITHSFRIGQLTLTNLRLKKGALDKFRLPVDVVEGMLPVSYIDYRTN
jgi:vacuolar protein sorting-associated protein 13A/C